jgi:hypothetical protein
MPSTSISNAIVPQTILAFLAAVADVDYDGWASWPRQFGAVCAPLESNLLNHEVVLE